MDESTQQLPHAHNYADALSELEAENSALREKINAIYAKYQHLDRAFSLIDPNDASQDSVHRLAARLWQDIKTLNELIQAETTRIGFDSFVEMANLFLMNYPESVFTGESGDAGAVFVAALRKALSELAKQAQETSKTGSTPGGFRRARGLIDLHGEKPEDITARMRGHDRALEAENAALHPTPRER